MVWCLMLSSFVHAQRVDSIFSSRDTLEAVISGNTSTAPYSNTRSVIRVRSIEYPKGNKSSFVAAVNTMPGVRMEERSPGSYRLNIRGSSLRSPFGVRNIKIYYQDIPLTDPGGNTYFNQLAFNNFSSLTAYKGPAGSLFGAGTGGAVLINRFGDWKAGFSAEYITGSFNTHNILVRADIGSTENQQIITGAHTTSDGWRDHTVMRRDNISWSTRMQLNKHHQLTALLLFTDMQYQTPGGLTFAEFSANPKAARPAGGGLPSAEQARATIYQKNILAGFTSHFKIDSFLNNTTTVYGSFAQIKNPAVRNYEQRSEPAAGGRTVFSWEKKRQVTNNGQDIYKINIGGEYQAGWFSTQVSLNKNGNRDTLQTNDEIQLNTGFVFAQFEANWHDSWLLSTGASLNYNSVAVTRQNLYPIRTQYRRYKNEFVPRINLTKKIGQDHAVTLTVSKGFSPPTIAEVLPSTSVINTALNAETGINYEIYGTLNFFRNKLRISPNMYHFRLRNALVQRRDVSGADYYINAGATRQTGAELNVVYTAYFGQAFFNLLELHGAYTYANFKYQNLFKDTANFNGKYLPGIPKHTGSVFIDLQTRPGIYIRSSLYTNALIWLNDANTARATPFHLLGGRMGFSKNILKKMNMDIYLGGENLLDETYSMGHDINDPRGRYYNAAAGRSWYAGIAVRQGR